MFIRNSMVGLRWGLVAMLLIALILVAGCGYKTVKATSEDDGDQVMLDVGQTLAISLEGNPTTGYTWEAAELDEGVLEQGETEYKASSKAIGAGGTETLQFKAIRAGEVALQLVYHRPWEKDVKPAKTYTLKVTVR